jgi:uncharacterized protein (DUF2345 family)
MHLTDGKTRDQASKREANANREQYQSQNQKAEYQSTETVGGIKKIEALCALKLNSAGIGTLDALDDLHQATGRHFNLVVGQKRNAAAGGDMQDQIKGRRKSVAGVSQRLIAPKNTLGRSR